MIKIVICSAFGFLLLPLQAKDVTIVVSTSKSGHSIPFPVADKSDKTAKTETATAKPAPAKPETTAATKPAAPKSDTVAAASKPSTPKTAPAPTKAVATSKTTATTKVASTSVPASKGSSSAKADSSHMSIGARLARLTAYWAGEGDYYTGKALSSTGIHLHGGCCAVDPRIIPYGSIVEIEGLGKYLAVDTGSAVISREAAREAGHNAAERAALVIDIFFESRAQGERFAAAGTRFAAITWTTPKSLAVGTALRDALNGAL